MAACREIEDSELFFDKYEENATTAIQVDQMCLHCPVVRECLMAGFTNSEWGVWGGIYLVNGKTDKNKNAHKSPEIWKKLKKVHGLTK